MIHILCCVQKVKKNSIRYFFGGGGALRYLLVSKVYFKKLILKKNHDTSIIPLKQKISKLCSTLKNFTLFLKITCKGYFK